MFGLHIGKNSDLVKCKTLEECVEKVCDTYDFNAAQIFTHGPQNYSMNKFDPARIKKYVQDNDIKLFVHSTYLTDGVWGALEENSPKKDLKYIKHIQSQIDACVKVGATGLVIHITRKPIKVLLRGLEFLEKEIKQKKIKFILEFRAMKPGKNVSYEDPERINALCEALMPINLDWGLCLDTSHMWATGVNVSDKSLVQDWLKRLNYPSKINLIHLNASQNNTFGVGKDKHIVPLSGVDDIWGDLCSAKKYEQLSDKEWTAIKRSSLGILLLWAKKNKIPLIGEFNRGTKHEFEFAIDVVQSILT